ncbi:hypothetical protein [Paenibacillus sp. V4I5]|uniref:hypothetical protein n=1 Tax=Paenibacillus sp. V4I5 TaxID=3042306 RepID=UPI0027907A01|nr:hypothetical protein [Paenibacillus sp. V4I5]MDQ0914739.1 hypothetical protein [Paenibacillus sp. V4I5]
MSEDKMKLIKKLLIEAGIIAALTTAAICLFINIDGVPPVSTIEQVEVQTQPLQQLDVERLTDTDGHAELMWVKPLNWPKIIMTFFCVFSIYLLVRLVIVWLLFRNRVKLPRE